MRPIVAFLAAILTTQTCLAWSEGGHHLIAVIAFDKMSPEAQAAALDLLKSHPRFDEDFKIPEKAADRERWLIGRAAYWPDFARKTPLDRPNWHWQLGANLVIGNANSPDAPGPCPTDATLDTKKLHIAQAIELCRRILGDKKQPATDRAIALCWICHLVGDAHQPCHSGSLFCQLFPDGDRGANLIPTKQGRNLHALWDGLLGPKWDEGDLRRRQKEIAESTNGIREVMDILATEEGGLDPMTWLKESTHFAKLNVYENEVLDPIKAAEEGGTLAPIALSERYLKVAGGRSQLRAAQAAIRLAMILNDDLKP